VVCVYPILVGLRHTAFTRHSGVNRYWLMDNGVITVRTRTVCGKVDILELLTAKEFG
jgi:hypothetical protein